MTTPPAPPPPGRLAAALLRLVTSLERAAAILGDIDEDLDRAALDPRTRRRRARRETWAFVAAEGWLAGDRAHRAARFVVRDACRSLRSSPGAALFMLMILTAGIGSATVVYSVVDAVVLRPLPFASPSRLVAVESTDRTMANAPASFLAPVVFDALRARPQRFTGIAAVHRFPEQVRWADRPELVPAARVSGGLFELLGAVPLVGRTITAADEAPGADRVVVIAHDLWQARYGGAADVLGRTIVAVRQTPTGPEDVSLTVVGVMPRGFTYPVTAGLGPQLWTPYRIPDDERATGPNVGSQYLHVVARLADDTGIAAVQTQVDAVLAAVAPAAPHVFDRQRLIVQPLLDTMLGPVRGWMLLALTAVALVMLVACANVANLMLSHAVRRARELSIRASIGASRRQLVGVLLTESLMLSTVAAALGLIAAFWGVETARRALPAGIARAADIGVDWRVLTASIGAAVATGLTFGVVPARLATRTDLIALLRSGALRASDARGGWRGGFLAAQVAFVGMLLVVTTLFVTSFVRLTTADLGFDRSHLVDVRPGTLRGAAADAIAALAAAPGIEAVAALSGSDAPLIGAGFGGGEARTGVARTDAPDPPINARFQRVSPGYFDATDTRLVRGRGFAATDLGATDVVVLNDEAARVVFGDLDPVGAAVRVGDASATVIGVVRAVRTGGPERPVEPEIFRPIARSAAGLRFLVRSRMPMPDVSAAVDAALGSMRPAGAAPAGVRRLEDAFRNITAHRRFSALLMSCFGVLALVIGGAGIYAVTASGVAQQTREIGIRMALGSPRSRVMARVLGQTARHLAIGLAVGLPSGWAVSQAFRSLLFGVEPGDGQIYLVVIVIVAVVGVVAAIVPARRAARVDPLVALRSE